MFIQTFPLTISTSLEKLSLFHRQMSLWQHYFVVLLVFFPQKGSILLFSFGHAFNKIAKPKCKRSFTELLKGYIFYIFIIIIIISSISNYSKLRDFFKNIYLQKIKEFIVYDGLYYITLQAGLKNIYFFLVVFTESNENMF